MAIFSKPLSVNPTCYELGHCWTPYCHKASTDIASHVFKESLKIYGTLYLVAGILRKRGLNYYVKKFVPETIRSSLFLTINGTLFISMFCIWRNMLGCLFFVTASFIPAYIAAFTAVLFERKSRRGALAVYLTNLAIETGYRMLVERKIVSPVRNGEVYLFSAVSAVYLYLFRKKDGLGDATQSLFKFIMGSDECPRTIPTLLSEKSAATSGREHRHDHLIDSSRTTKSYQDSYSHRGSRSSLEVDVRKSQGGSIFGDKSSSGGSLGEDETSSAGSLAGDETSSGGSLVGDESLSGVSFVGDETSSGGSLLRDETSSLGSLAGEEETSTESLESSSSRPRGSKALLSSSTSSSLQATIYMILQKLPLLSSLVGGVKEQLRPVLRSFEQLPRHKCCHHNHSCISYVLKGGAKMFTLGYVVQAMINSLSVASRILKKPSTLKNTWFSKLNLKLAAFLGGYCAVFRAVNCILRWIRNKDSELHGCIAGALAGLSLRFYRSITIALYTATKLMEILYFKGIHFYGFPYIKSADIFIYAFSTAFILHAAVLEPHTLRPGYWKFLLRVTNNRFAFMNRKLLDVFGVNSSKIQPDYWPDYEPGFSTLTRNNS